jgi:RNA polymerase sigma factor (sigma-70 family)
MPGPTATVAVGPGVAFVLSPGPAPSGGPPFEIAEELPMSPFDPNKPPAAPAAAGERVLTTTSGVKIKICEPPPPRPRRRSEPRVPPTQAIIFPPGQPAHEREAFFRSLSRQFGPFIEKMLILEGILPESAKDLRQDVLVIVVEHVDAREPILNAKAFLCGALRNAAWNHKRLKRLTARGNAEVEEAIDDARDPEEAAKLAEEWRTLRRYFDLLSKEDAWLIERHVFDGATVDEIAAELGRPRGTAADCIARAKERLADLAAASERETRFGLRRRPGTARI